METWSVGQLAEATGLTVRTLHHWDSVGLLVPSQRTGAGHRRYARAEVERLERIAALRRLGLPLAEIATALDREGPDLRAAVRRQLDQVQALDAGGEGPAGVGGGREGVPRRDGPRRRPAQALLED